MAPTALNTYIWTFRTCSFTLNVSVQRGHDDVEFTLVAYATGSELSIANEKDCIRKIVRTTWPLLTMYITNNQQAYCELAAYVGDQTTFDNVLQSVDKYDRDALQKFIAEHACTVALSKWVALPPVAAPAAPVVALPQQATIHTFNFECKCASSSYVRVYIGSARPVCTYDNTHHEQECSVAQTCLNIIAYKPIRPVHAPTCNQEWLHLVAAIGDQACFDVIENWVVTYDYDMLKDFVAQHNLAVKLPARTSYHTFMFDRTGGGPLVEIILGRRNDVIFIHSMKRLSGDVANMTMKCVSEIITSTFIPATYKCPPANATQTWAELAAFTNNIKTYKQVVEWSPGAIDQDVFDFAQTHGCNAIVEYMTPRTKEVTCTIGTYTITWQVSKRQDHVTKSAVVTGSLQESDFAVVASVIARATDRTKPIHIGTGLYADVIFAAYKQIDEFSKACY
jgi:hypothetical protein